MGSLESAHVLLPLVGQSSGNHGSHLLPTLQSSTNGLIETLSSLTVLESVTPGALIQETIRPLGEFPELPDRSFQFEVKSYDIKVNWDPIEGEKPWTLLRTQEQRDAIKTYSKTIKTWIVYVWNSALPVEEQIRLHLFPEFAPAFTKAGHEWNRPAQKKGREPPANEKYFTRGGALDVSICPTYADACKVATEACRLLDRLPFEIDGKDFPARIDTSPKEKANDSDMRKLVDLMSLRAIVDKFDFRKMRYIFRRSRTQSLK